MVGFAIGIVLHGTAAAYSVGEADDGAPLRLERFPVDWAWSDADRPAEVALAEDAAWDAFDVWGAIDGARIGFHEGEARGAPVVAHDGTNFVVFAVPWLHDPDLLALTSSWATADGEILGFDIEINADKPWSTAGAADAYDLQSALVHEVGHAIGLGHSAVETAAMYPTAGVGSVGRQVLDPDDIDGARFLYPDDAGEAPDLGPLSALGCASAPVPTGLAPLGIALAMTLIGGSGARAASFARIPTWDELAMRSRAVVVGVVREAACGEAPYGLVTRYAIDVSETLAGDVGADDVIVDLPGGLCGPDGLVQTFAGVPRWAVGDEVVLFVPADGGPQPLTGVFTVGADRTLIDPIGRPDPDGIRSVDALARRVRGLTAAPADSRPIHAAGGADRGR